MKDSALLLIKKIILVGIPFSKGIVGFQSCSQKSRTYTKDGIKVTTYTSPQFANIHYVQVEDLTIMFDSGDVGDSTKIEKFFAKKELSLAEVDYLIIAHGHADHGGNAQYFKEKYNMKIIAGAGKEELIATGGVDKDLCPRGFQSWIDFWKIRNDELIYARTQLKVTRGAHNLLLVSTS